MQKSPVSLDQLPRSVLAVPPLCRCADHSLDETANRALIDHMTAGGVRTLMYGGNANFYNLPTSHYRPTVTFLADATAEDVLVIPSAGPDYGHLMDQAPILREHGYPTAMAPPPCCACTCLRIGCVFKRRGNRPLDGAGILAQRLLRIKRILP